LIADFVAEGVPVCQVGGDLLRLGNLARVMREAARWRPDIIHGAVSDGIIMAAAAGAVSRRSKVILEEPGYPSRRSWRGHLLLRALAAMADSCVAVSPAMEEYFARLGIPVEKTRLIVNGAPEPSIPAISERPALRRALGIPETAFVVGSVGRLLDVHKRFSDLLRAMKLLRANNPDLRLLLVGDGPDRLALESLSRELGVRNVVTFAGYRADVGSMYAAMDLFALVSESESFGLVLVEAMFAGLAVVGTRTSGIANVVEDGVTGVLVPVRAPEEIAAAVSSLKQDAERVARMGAAGRERALRYFSSQRYVSDVAKLYEDVLRADPLRADAHSEQRAER
jgi:glycosyltransferase involved in cell wall biosynthesis